MQLGLYNYDIYCYRIKIYIHLFLKIWKHGSNGSGHHVIVTSQHFIPSQYDYCNASYSFVLHYILKIHRTQSMNIVIIIVIQSTIHRMQEINIVYLSHKNHNKIVKFLLYIFNTFLFFTYYSV